MALVKLNKKEIKDLLKEEKDEKIDEILSMFGTAVESISEDKIEVEVAPNRPDLLSQQGIIRALKSYLKKEPGLKNYKINKPEKNYEVKIDSSVKNVRPYTSCAVVKNLSFNDEKIKEIIDLQEKLHNTLGRNRKKAAIGIYPLEKIKLPIVYKAEKPDKIKFIPLEFDKEITGKEMLKKHPAGKTYAHLLSGLEIFPIFTDAGSNILSMPPIINSEETGRITNQTKEIFIECSGFQQEILNKILSIIATALADMGGTVYQMDLIYGSKTIRTPDLNPDKIKISIENVNKLLGLDLKEKDIEKYLNMMGFEYKNKVVYIPAWRTDILHEVDIIEEISIAYGYQNLIPEIPQISTIGQESDISKLHNKVSGLVTGLGITEISSYHLIKQKEAEISKIEKIEVENSKTEYKFLRPDLLIPILRFYSENKSNDYPQNVFEKGTVFSIDKKTETGISEKENLIIALSPGNFTQIKQVLNYLSENLGFSFKMKEASKNGLIEGRSASIIINEKHSGCLGEVHPETLNDWNIKMPVSVLEICINDILTVLKLP